MPRGDGTGPMGMGPMTGRAAGYCAGYSVPGFMNPIPGRGFGGLGMGFGRGRGLWGYGRGVGRGTGFGWGRGRGMGWGRGRGMGWGRGWGWRAGYGLPLASGPYAGPAGYYPVPYGY